MRSVWVVIALAACGSSSRPATSDGARGGDALRLDTGGGSGGGNIGQSAVYAHTATSLYRIDPDTYAATKVGDFGLTGLLDVMTDIAIDANGNLVGVTFSSVYSVDANTGHATLLSSGSLLQQFNGLSFVPATALGQTGADVLIGTDNSDGNVFSVNSSTGVTSVIGNMGGTFHSSGDVVSVDGFGTVQTVPGTTHDVLVKLMPPSFTATPIGTNTGFDKIYGLGFWKGKVFGFTYTGQIITIDPMTGAGTMVANSGVQWNGAAVTTVAPVIP
jgi:hypothetical protein